MCCMFIYYRTVHVVHYRFMEVLFNIVNADYRNVSLAEKVINNYPPPVYLRNLLALIQVSIVHCSCSNT